MSKIGAKPLVSSIIIFFNEAPFLAEAIESAIAQTYAHWELLLIDDGSTDGSSDIACAYAERYPQQVSYLTHKHHQNKGMSASRNFGIAQAKGHYIAYLDGDDVWVPHKLAEQVEILTAQPEAAMVYGPLLAWHSWMPVATQPDGLYGNGKNGIHPYRDSVVEPPNLLTLFLEDEDFIPSGGLIKRDAIRALGGYEEAFRGGYSDAIAFVKLCLVEPVIVSSQCWYKYRQHPNSSTAKSILTGKDIAEEQIYLTWVEDYLSQQNVVDQGIWKALDKALWPHRHPKCQGVINRCKHLISITEEGVVVVGRRLLPQCLRHWLWMTIKGNRHTEAAPASSYPVTPRRADA